MKCEKGFSLIETTLSLALLGIIGVGFLCALAISAKVAFNADDRQAALNLAETQMEYIKAQQYDTSEYAIAPIPVEYANYNTTIVVEPLYSQESNIQKVTVTITRQGKVITVLDDYKVK